MQILPLCYLHLVAASRSYTCAQDGHDTVQHIYVYPLCLRKRFLCSCSSELLWTSASFPMLLCTFFEFDVHSKTACILNVCPSTVKKYSLNVCRMVWNLYYTVLWTLPCSLCLHRQLYFIKPLPETQLALLSSCSGDNTGHPWLHDGACWGTERGLCCPLPDLG